MRQMHSNPRSPKEGQLTEYNVVFGLKATRFKQLHIRYVAALGMLPTGNSPLRTPCDIREDVFHKKKKSPVEVYPPTKFQRCKCCIKSIGTLNPILLDPIFVIGTREGAIFL